MLALEMLFDVEVSVAMVKGAEQAGLPVSMGLVCICNPGGQVELFGTGRDNLRGKQNTLLSEALPQILEAVKNPEKLIVSIMHSEIEHTGPALAAVRESWNGLVAAYPNVGHYAAPGGWDTSAGCSVAEFADEAERWMANGAAFVGGMLWNRPRAHSNAGGSNVSQPCPSINSPPGCLWSRYPPDQI